jgi:putative ABC transport system ATP-binding protein
MRGIGAGTRIFTMLERTPAVQPGKGIALSPDRRGAVKFENIGFEYPTRPGVKVLNGLDLTVNVGESVAIVYVHISWLCHPFSDTELTLLLPRYSGKSGGGKSSIHSLLLRYYDPVSGKVTFDGQGHYILSMSETVGLCTYLNLTI